MQEPVAKDIEFIDHIVNKLKKSGSLTGAQIGSDASKKKSWKDAVDAAGGKVKLFCQKHADKIKWVVDGGAVRIELVKTGSLPIGTNVKSGSILVGARVCVNRDASKQPTYGWGDVRSWSIGTVQTVSGKEYEVEFPEVVGKWKCLEGDLKQTSEVDRSTRDFGAQDPACSQAAFVCNKSGGKFEFTGNLNAGKVPAFQEIGFVQGKKQLTSTQPYFEVTIDVHAPGGVGIGLSSALFWPGAMVGWPGGRESDSLGFHSENGNFYHRSITGTKLGGPVQVGEKMGCGVLFESDKPKAVYFSRQGIVVGRFPLRPEDSGLLFPVVSSAAPAAVRVNFAASAPTISMAPIASEALVSPSKGSAKTSKEASKVSAETTNFARYCRLLMDVGRDVLMILFEASYQKEANAPWTESSGRPFLSTHFSDGPSQRRLGKHLVDNICDGQCKAWDITLLSSLLTTTPGYIKKNKTALKAVEYLRGERNHLAHSPGLLAKQSLTEEEFAGKWEPIMKSLVVLMDELLPVHKAEYLVKIDEISSETLPESDLTSLFEKVNEDINRIRDVAEDAREKAHEALEKAGNAASLSKVNDLIAKSLKSVLNQDGRVDQKSLPCEVILSNQQRYRVYKLVGKGGMGAVYEAKLVAPDSDGIKVALKICDPNASSERAEREADILQKLTKLKHENIVNFIDSALDGSLLVIIMELIKGKPLDFWLDEKYVDGGSVTLDQTKPIVQQLVAGMAFVHSHNIAHRDLKPGNLMFDEVTGKLVIVDFGLSKQHNTNSTMTKADAQLGTLLYMSPEQLESDIQAISFPSDIWAIGVIWHELLTSRTPFQPLMQSDPGSSSNLRSKAKTFSMMDQNTVVTMACKKGPRQLPMLEQLDNVPKGIISIIATCLNTDIYARHRDATELSRHIEDVFRSLESGGPKAPDKKRFKDWDAQSVSKLIRSISSKLAASADAMEEEECIDGKLFMKMLDTDDDLLTMKVVDGGLGFSKLQLKSVKSKIEDLE